MRKNKSQMKIRPELILLLLLVLIGLTFCTEEGQLPVLEKLSTTVTVSFPPVSHDPDSTPDLPYGSIADMDGNIYKTIQVGTQTWMAENLKTTKYNDGSPILFGTGGPAGYTDWFDIGKGAYCWYENDANAFKNPYGAIYNWHSAGTGKICPTGWHIPDNSEWITLITFLGGKEWIYNQEQENASLDWGSSNDKLIASGFTPVNTDLLCGELTGWGFGVNGGIWWSTTTDREIDTYSRANVPCAYCIYFLSKDGDLLFWKDFEPQSYGFSIRCLKD